MFAVGPSSVALSAKDLQDRANAATNVLASNVRDLKDKLDQVIGAEVGEVGEFHPILAGLDNLIEDLEKLASGTSDDPFDLENPMGPPPAISLETPIEPQPVPSRPIPPEVQKPI